MYNKSGWNNSEGENEFKPLKCWEAYLWRVHWIAQSDLVAIRVNQCYYYLFFGLSQHRTENALWQQAQLGSY